MQKAGSAPTLPALLYFQEAEADKKNRNGPLQTAPEPPLRPGRPAEKRRRPHLLRGPGRSLPHRLLPHRPPRRRYRRIQLPRHRPGLQSQPPARMDPPPVRTEEILSDTQKPLISLREIRGFLYFIDSIDSFHPFRRNFARSFIFTTDNIPLLFKVPFSPRFLQG